MDYETARRVRGASLGKLTLRNIEQNKGLLSFAASGFGATSAVKAVSQKFSASITGLIESVDPLNLLSMLGPGWTTYLGAFMPFRSRESRRYFRRKAEQRQRDKRHYSKVGPGRATRLKVGDSTADILAKMLNLMQKDHDETIKRLELERERSEEHTSELQSH